MTAKVFIDGAAGTTGLEIRERLAGRRDISLVQLSDAMRKDPAARAGALNESDLVILCLPDEAAREAVNLIGNNSVRVIDASSAHRVARDWTYGFPEMDGGQQRVKIASAKRVSNPGCYPTGFIALVRPLRKVGMIRADFPITVNAISGYSGGGKAMIAEFEDTSSPAYVETVARTYALGLAHKHMPEMQEYGEFTHPPVFSPSVGRFYRGMIVEVPLPIWSMPDLSALLIQQTLEDAYRGAPLVEVASMDEAASLKVLDAESLKNTNNMKLYVFANREEGLVRLVAVLDNLGKGAGGAAVQNLNIMLGLPETEGLL